MITALFWVITQQAVVLPYRRFGTTYRPHLQGSIDPWRLYHFLDQPTSANKPSSRCLNLNMGPIGCPETSVRNYRYSLRNNPEQRSSLRRSCKIRAQVHTEHCHNTVTRNRRQTSRASETTVFAYKNTRCQDAEDHKPKDLRYENLKHGFIFIPDAKIRKILRWIFRQLDVQAWTGLIWLRTGTGGRHLLMR